MNGDWRFDDDALDELIRRATETIEPPAGFTQRVHATISRNASAKPAGSSLRWYAPLFAAAAVLALLVVGWRVQTLFSPVPTHHAPDVVNADERTPAGDRAVVRVRFEQENDAIVIREPSSNPNVTIMWIHPVASQQAAAGSPTQEPGSTEPTNQPRKGNDS